MEDVYLISTLVNKSLYYYYYYYYNIVILVTSSTSFLSTFTIVTIFTRTINNVWL